MKNNFPQSIKDPMDHKVFSSCYMLEHFEAYIHMEFKFHNYSICQYFNKWGYNIFISNWIEL